MPSASVLSDDEAGSQAEDVPEEVRETVLRLRQQADDTKSRETEQALRRLDLSPEEERVIRETVDSLVDRLLEPPVDRLVEATEEEDEVVETAKRMFELGE